MSHPRRRSARHPWYTEAAGFFGPEYLKEYKNLLTPKRTKEEVDFIVKKLRLKKEAKILDLACGHGRHAVEFARRGFDVVGFDLNAFFLKEAEMSAKRARVRVRWMRGDMRRLPFKSEFDVVVNLFTAFGYFARDADDQKVLAAVARALRPGGTFILDVSNRERILRLYQEKDWEMYPDGTIVLFEREFDFATGRNYERRTVLTREGKKEFRVVVRFYSLNEFYQLLKQAGLKPTAAFGDYTGSPVTLDSKRFLIFSKKR